MRNSISTKLTATGLEAATEVLCDPRRGLSSYPRSRPVILVVLLVLLGACGVAPDEEDIALSDNNDSAADDDGSTADDDDSAADDEDSAPEPVNVLLDPSFEEGAPWSIWGGASRVESPTLDGQWALMATNGNGAEQVLEGLEPDTTYRLSGWAMTSGDQPMTIGVKDYTRRKELRSPSPSRRTPRRA